MIKFDHVTKMYGANVGLQDVTIDIKEGEFVFIVGPSGAGKSTFFKLIMKELQPDSGRIYINDIDCTRLSNREIPMLRRFIGMVSQDFRLLPNKTVAENIAFAMEVVHTTNRTIKRKVPQVLTLMGIPDKGDMFPDELAGGEQQRVAIARAIVNNPKILIADEPTGNLDPDTAWEIMSLLSEINKRGTTVVVVTHSKELVNKMKKRVIAIESGCVLKDEQEGEYGYND